MRLSKQEKIKRKKELKELVEYAGVIYTAFLLTSIWTFAGLGFFATSVIMGKQDPIQAFFLSIVFTGAVSILITSWKYNK